MFIEEKYKLRIPFHGIDIEAGKYTCISNWEITLLFHIWGNEKMELNLAKTFVFVYAKGKISFVKYLTCMYKPTNEVTYWLFGIYPKKIIAFILLIFYKEIIFSIFKWGLRPLICNFPASLNILLWSTSNINYCLLVL